MRIAWVPVVAAAVLVTGVNGCSREAPMAGAIDESAYGAPAPEAQAAPQRAAGASPAADGGGSAQAPAAAFARKLVKTVDLTVQVRDTRQSAERLQQVAARLGGYLAAMSAERRGELLYYTLTLRVPVERLDEAVAAVEREAERVDRQSVRTEDVTERWVDLSARLKTLRATEEELQKLLAESRQRGQELEDIMAVYEKLTEIRSAIEQLQGQLVALESLAALSTVNVQLHPTEGARPIVDEGWQPGETLRRAVRALVQGLQGLADFAIVLLVVGLPLLLAVLLPVWIVFVLLRRWLRRRRAPPSPE
jgi:hypothetical protein